MFQPKSSLGNQSPLGGNLDNASPENSGTVRTLKSDYENFKTGKPIDSPDVPPAAKAPAEAAQKKDEAPAPKSFAASAPLPPAEKIPEAPPVKPMLQNVPLVAPEKPAQNNLSRPPLPAARNSGVPNPFGSNEYFQDNTNFENVGEELNKEVKKTASSSSGKWTMMLAILLVLALTGGGLYYWWFFMKNQSVPSPATSSNTQAPPKSSATSNQTPQQPANAQDKFIQWTIDPSLDKIATKKAIKDNADAFVASSPNGTIKEIKLISKDNQSILPAKFQELFDFQLPAGVSDKLTNDYSIFVVRENGAPRMGAAFKLSKTDNLAETLKNDESSVTTKLKSFYLDATLPDTPPSFSSSKYNNSDIRYYNFTSPTGTSLDYSLVPGQGNDFFVFATSKDAMRSILDYMSKK